MADRLPFDVFARTPQLTDPRLAPDGKHLVVTTFDAKTESYRLLFFALDGDTYRLLNAVPVGVNVAPYYTQWIGPDRVVFELGRKSQASASPYPTGEILTAEMVHGTQRYLFGPMMPAAHVVGGSPPTAEAAWGHYNGQPYPQNGHFLISVVNYDDSDFTRLTEINALTGAMDTQATLDGSYMTAVVDEHGVARYGYGLGNDFRYRSLWLHDGQWQALDPSRHFKPVAITGHTVYGLQTDSDGTAALVSQPLDGGPVSTLAEDAIGSIDTIEWTPPPRQPFATTLGVGRPQPTYIERQSAASRLHQQLSAKFPDAYVHFIDFSNDGATLLFSVASDRAPPDYYLWRKQSGTAKELFSEKPWIDPRQMAERRSLFVTSRDGLPIEVILTMPLNAPRGVPLPMVLIMRGDSLHSREQAGRASWYFDATAQFLANRGYLVAQVNARGSGGRGEHFETLGYGQWHGTILNDLTDASHQLIAHGYADPMRICTYGEHLGAYIAVRIAIQQPDVFRCAIGDSGIYDLATLYHQAYFGHTIAGRAQLRTVLGQDSDTLSANSPIKLAARLTAPVLLIHGKDDIWYPYAQAEALRDALKHSGNPPTWLALDDEDSLMRHMDGAIQRLQAIQSFLDDNLLPKVTTEPLQPQHGHPQGTGNLSGGRSVSTPSSTR
ncbi:alpha/beta hydrolase family protein [Frateuria aurantia]